MMLLQPLPLPLPQPLPPPTLQSVLIIGKLMDIVIPKTMCLNVNTTAVIAATKVGLIGKLTVAT